MENGGARADKEESTSSVPSLSAYVALQDVHDPEMGPTIYLPGTHREETHAAFFADGAAADHDGGEDGMVAAKAKLLVSTPRQLGLMSAGEVTIFDQRLLHAGSANTAGRRRLLLCISFMSRSLSGNGPTGSLREEYEGRYSLRDFVANDHQALKAEL